MRIAVEIVEPVVLHTSQAQPQSREKVSSGVVSLPTEHAATRRDTYETWGHHAFSRARKPETRHSNGLYNGALASGRLGSGRSVVGVMDEVMSNGGVRAGCEAGCLFLEWQQWRVPSADQSCTTDTTETHAGGAGQSCQRCCAARAHQT